MSTCTFLLYWIDSECFPRTTSREGRLLAKSKVGSEFRVRHPIQNSVQLYERLWEDRSHLRVLLHAGARARGFRTVPTPEVSSIDDRHPRLPTRPLDLTMALRGAERKGDVRCRDGREYSLDMGPAQRHEDDDDGRIDRLAPKEDELVTGTRVKVAWGVR